MKQENVSVIYLDIVAGHQWDVAVNGGRTQYYNIATCINIKQI